MNNDVLALILGAEAAISLLQPGGMDVRIFASHASFIVLIAVLLTWVNPEPYNPIVRFLRSVTEPVFYQVRRRMPFVVIGG